MSNINKTVDKWLFETTYQKYSTEDAASINKIPSEAQTTSLPIMPMDQMATQLSQERPPVEDPEWVPSGIEDLSAAASQLAKSVPDDQVSFFYEEIQNLRDSAIEKSRKKEIDDSVFEDDPISSPIKASDVKKESIKKKNNILKKRVASRRKGYIIDVTKNKKGSVMSEAWKSARQRDFARKWKQGDRLDLHRDEEDDVQYSMDDYRDMDDYDIDIEDGEEFVPDVDDIRDFMDANDEDDPTRVPGFTEDMAQEFGLADMVRSNVYPSVSRESGITNKLEREIYPILRASKNAPQLTDRLNTLIKSDFAKSTFYESMLFAGLIDQEHITALKEDEEALVTSEMYKYVVHQTIIIPAMKQLEKLRKAGVYDPASKKSQISPDEADAIVEKIKKRWLGMTKARKANDARKGMQADLEFLERDTSVMG